MEVIAVSFIRSVEKYIKGDQSVSCVYITGTIIIYRVAQVILPYIPLSKIGCN